jgi:DNA-binding HxlR family transcriptional regulator
MLFETRESREQISSTVLQDTAMTKHVSCPTEMTLALISGRWKAMVIYWLIRGERRFNQLQRDLSAITHRTLAKQLRELEADGLVERRDFGEIPPRVEYRLTPLGRSLEPVLLAMDAWAVAHAAALRGRGQAAASASTGT